MPPEAALDRPSPRATCGRVLKPYDGYANAGRLAGRGDPLMKKAAKRLTLARETLTQLDANLIDVWGGGQMTLAGSQCPICSSTCPRPRNVV